MNETRRSGAWALLAWVGFGVLLGLAMTCLRVATVRLGPGADREGFLALRLLSDEWLTGAAVGVVTVGVLWVLSSSRKRAWARIPAIALVLAGATLFVVTGGFWASASLALRVVQAAGPPTRVWFLALTVAGTLAAALLGSRPARPLVGLGLVGLGLGALLLGPTLVRLAFRDSGPTMQVRDVRRDLLLGGRGWKVVEHHPEAEPRVGILNPTSDFTRDTAELPALIMPPPCTVEFEILPEDGTVELRTAVGIHHATPARKKPVGFEILRNGEVVYSVELGPEGPPGQWTWPHDRLEFEPGDVLGLRTSLVGAPPELAAERESIDAGFAELLLEYVDVAPRQLSSPDAPSVLVIVQDTLRADALSCYGQEQPTTPVLDALAARGVRFADARSTSSWTWPSTASMLTGLLPEAHNVVDDDACYMAEGLDTLAEVLQRQGFTTAAFTCNPLIVTQKNFDQGFETFDGNHSVFRESTAVMPSILRWIDRNAGTRFFLYLHLADPHAPHIPLPQFRQAFAPDAPTEVPRIQKIIVDCLRKVNAGAARDEDGNVLDWPFPPQKLKWLRSLYLACVATGDHHLGTVLDRLAYHGIDDETLVVFTSDHGEEWYDHGGLGHGQSLHPELTHVPLILAGPGIPEGVVIENTVSNRHLATTLALWAGTSLPRVPDALDLLSPAAREPRDVFVSTHHGWAGKRCQELYGVLNNDWSLHLAPEGLWWGEQVEGGWTRLYDLRADRLEHQDVSAAHEAVVQALRERLLANIEAQTALQPNVQLETGADTLEMLRQIGYLMDE